MLKHSLTSIHPQSDLDADPRALNTPDREDFEVEEAEREALAHQTQSLQNLLDSESEEQLMSDHTFQLELEAWLERTVDPQALADVRKVIDEAIVRRTQEAASAFHTGVKLQRELRIATRKIRKDTGLSNPKRGKKS